MHTNDSDTKGTCRAIEELIYGGVYDICDADIEDIA